MNIDSGLIFVALPYICLGMVSGFCSGLLGIGGGIVLVPAFYYLWSHFPAAGHHVGDVMHIALATSIAIILPTVLSSSWAQIKRRAVEWSIVRKFSPGLAIGSVLGVVLVSHLDKDILKLVFAVGLFGIGLSMFVRKEDGRSIKFLNRKISIFPFSTLFGVLSPMLGISGAVLNIPYMNKAGIPIKTAIATASVLGAVVALTSILTYIAKNGTFFGNIDAMAFLIIIPISVMMAPIGVRASHALPVKKLKYVFAGLLILVSLKMLLEVI